MTWLPSALVLAAWMGLCGVITKHLFEHYLGTCYRVSYTDIYGEQHAFRIISRDSREAAIITQIFKELSSDSSTTSGTIN